MPVRFVRGIRSRGRPLSVMAHLQNSVVEVKSSENCLAHAIIMAIAKLEKILIIKHIGKVERYVL
jgi:ribosome-associated translation inhibitor RaiA